MEESVIMLGDYTPEGVPQLVVKKKKAKKHPQTFVHTNLKHGTFIS